MVTFKAPFTWDFLGLEQTSATSLAAATNPCILQQNWSILYIGDKCLMGPVNMVCTSPTQPWQITSQHCRNAMPSMHYTLHPTFLSFVRSITPGGRELCFPPPVSKWGVLINVNRKAVEIKGMLMSTERQ